MSLAKVRAWIEKNGRYDIGKGRSERELAVLDRFCRIALDLQNVVPHQGAKAGKGGEQCDLYFGRLVETRKTPILFCGVILAQPGKDWYRKGDPLTDGTARIYLKLSEAGGARSDWADMVHDDDAATPDKEWRYLELPERVPVDGDELLDLVEDAYFEVAGI